MYFQLKEKIIEQIKSNVLRVGDRVYSETELCEMFNVSRITAKRVLNELVQEGYIERIPGKGSFVRSSPIDHVLSTFYSFTEEIKKLGMTPSSRIINFEKITPDAELKKQLNMKSGKVYYLRRQRLADNEVIALDHSFIPYSILGNINAEELETHSLYEILTLKGYMPDRAIESFTASLLSDENAKLLEAEPESPTLKVYRKTYFKDQIIEYNYRYYKNNRYIYTIELK